MGLGPARAWGLGSGLNRQRRRPADSTTGGASPLEDGPSMLNLHWLAWYRRPGAGSTAPTKLRISRETAEGRLGEKPCGCCQVARPAVALEFGNSKPILLCLRCSIEQGAALAACALELTAEHRGSSALPVDLGSIGFLDRLEEHRRAIADRTVDR